MIKQWAVSNFKSIREKVDIDFAPLTLFVGQNSAGKSTLIQNILLTAQTIQSNATSRSVILNGRIIRLGAFSDIRSNRSMDESVTVEFELGRPVFEIDSFSVSSIPRYYYTSELQERMSSVKCSYTFSAGKLSETNKELQLQPQIEKGNVQYFSSDVRSNSSFEYKRISDAPEYTLQKLGVSQDNVRIPDLAALEFQAVAPNAAKNYRRAYRLPVQTVPAGVLLRHFLPYNVGAAYDAVEVEVDSIFEMLSDPSARYNYSKSSLVGFIEAFASPELRLAFVQACRNSADSLTNYSRRLLDNLLEEVQKKFDIDNILKIQSHLQSAGRKALAIQLNEREVEIKALIRGERSPRKEISAFPVPDAIMYATDRVTSFFTEKLKYLGPLRDEPKSIFPLAGYNDPKDIGFKGEFTAAVLDNNKTSPVTYIPSSRFPFAQTDEIEPIRATLGEAVQDWLEYLGIANKVATEDKGKLGHELTISTATNDNFHDLTHVGVGVSQALPIVVLSLLADTGSSLIFEQPELHLHPRVQTRLADFFMSLTFCGKQCVIETHSEYLISRLRFLSAVAKDVPISKLIKIYFVEKPGEQSVYNSVEITETGVIKNWPDGFFDETERNSEAILRAQLERARLRRNSAKSGDKT